MDITVLSRAEAEAHDFNSGDWVISINEKFDDLATLRSPGRVLVRVFWDVSEGQTMAMDEGDAEHILKFAQEAQAAHKALYVHCRAGISRSAAVADALATMGIARWVNKDAQAYVAGVGYQSRFHPNAHVAALLKRAHWQQTAGAQAETIHVCPKCGAHMEWAECTEPGCDDGWIEGETLVEEDPLWYDESDRERCPVCQGAGGWWQCPNAETHFKEQAGASGAADVDIPF